MKEGQIIIAWEFLGGQDDEWDEELVDWKLSFEPLAHGLSDAQIELILRMVADRL
jgi:hypothetical protein